MRSPIPLLLGLALLGGCTVGPDFKRPVVAGADAPWVGDAAPGAVDAQWWKALGDPVLDALVEAATAGNLDIREAEARLREARADRKAAGARGMPQVNVVASAVETQLSRNGPIPIYRLPGFENRFPLFDAGFDASWEIDLWGAARRGVEAATARTAAAEARAGDVRLQVIAEIGRSYAELRANQARLASLQADAGLRAEIAALSLQRFTAGEAPRSEAVEAARRADVARARIAGAEADVRQAGYRLALLTGRPPEALLQQLAAPAPIPKPPVIVAAGIRSDLLLRRADVRAAEADLAAATADIGVATADLFPRISLIGALGLQAQSLGDLAGSDSARFQVGPSFSWPIFSAGRIRARIAAADARADAAGARYEKAVLSALSDSETALNRYAATRRARGDTEAALGQTHVAAALAAERFRKGEDDRIAMLEAQSAGQAAELQAISARTETLAGYLAVAKSLGGGWQGAK
jgi:NodT family efflux transporter outer membrane factor (OMF) lipoprotein